MLSETRLELRLVELSSLTSHLRKVVRIASPESNSEYATNVDAIPPSPVTIETSELRPDRVRSSDCLEDRRLCPPLTRGTHFS